MTRDKPPLDDFGRDYARLAFGIERHVPGFIDAWLGPQDARAALDADPAPTPARARRRRARSPRAHPRAWTCHESRKGYLTKQIEAMLANARRAAGEEIPTGRRCGSSSTSSRSATPEAVYEAAIADLDQLLPGDGPVAGAHDRLARGLHASRPDAPGASST